MMVMVTTVVMSMVTLMMATMFLFLKGNVSVSLVLLCIAYDIHHINEGTRQAEHGAKSEAGGRLLTPP